MHSFCSVGFLELPPEASAFREVIASTDIFEISGKAALSWASLQFFPRITGISASCS
jgi:hypothetical protein